MEKSLRLLSKIKMTELSKEKLSGKTKQKINNFVTALHEDVLKIVEEYRNSHPDKPKDAYLTAEALIEHCRQLSKVHPQLFIGNGRKKVYIISGFYANYLHTNSDLGELDSVMETMVFNALYEGIEKATGRISHNALQLADSLNNLSKLYNLLMNTPLNNINQPEVKTDYLNALEAMRNAVDQNIKALETYVEKRKGSMFQVRSRAHGFFDPGYHDKINNSIANGKQLLELVEEKQSRANLKSQPGPS